MTEETKSIIGKLFGAAIVIWGIVAVSSYIAALVTLNPAFSIIGFAATIGCAGFFGIAKIVYENFYG